MTFERDSLHHVYNRTFNHTLAFSKAENYRFFIRKVSALRDICDIICFCLMPDHFHLILYMPLRSPGADQMPNRQMQVLSRRIGTLLSSYTRAFNTQERRTGSLFQPRTKVKLLDENAIECFNYIHRNPVKAGLAFNMGDWEFSSYREYHHNSKGVCNTELGRRLLGL